MGKLVVKIRSKFPKNIYKNLTKRLLDFEDPSHSLDLTPPDAYISSMLMKEPVFQTEVLRINVKERKEEKCKKALYKRSIIWKIIMKFIFQWYKF